MHVDDAVALAAVPQHHRELGQGGAGDAERLGDGVELAGARAPGRAAGVRDGDHVAGAVGEEVVVRQPDEGPGAGVGFRAVRRQAADDGDRDAGQLALDQVGGGGELVDQRRSA